MSDHDEGRGVSGEEFQKIKNERFAEKRNAAEARRQQHLQRIRDMKSTTGIHPVDRFPNEMWEKIFTFLRPKDLGAVSEVHDLFHELLSSRRICDVLLPQILNLKFAPSWNNELDPEDEDYYGHSDDSQDWEFKMPMADVEWEEFVKLREVSKSLRNNIDQLFENMITRSLRRKEENPKVVTCTLSFFYFFGTREDDKLNGILENFSVGSNRAKRFFLRSLKVDVRVSESESEELEGNSKEAFSQFKFKVTSLLEIIGDQIWRFEWYFYSDWCRGVPFPQIYITLKEWADLMPNLKWLVLNIEYGCSSLETPNMESDVLRNICKDSPFPHLPHLARICWEFDSKNDSRNFDMFLTVIKANPHVKAVSMTRKNCERMNRKKIDSFFKEQWNSLASLPLDFDMFLVDANHEVTFECIQPVINPNWQLKRMHLGCDVYNSTLKSVFELLENFPTLEDLALSLVAARFEVDVPFLKLPNLTHLKLKVSYAGYYKHVIEFTPATNFFFSLQFLLFTKKLKRLEWRLEVWNTFFMKIRRFLVNRECHEQCVNFRAGMRDLRSSNLWEVFPFLEKVEFSLRKAYDHGFEMSVWGYECERSNKF